MKNVSLLITALLVLLLLCSCKPRVKVSGTLNGEHLDGSQVTPVALNIYHSSSGSSNPVRMVTILSTGDTVFPGVAAKLRVTEERNPPNFAESYHFFGVSPVNQVFSPVFTPANESFFNRYIGRTVYLQMRQNDNSVSETVTGNHVIHGDYTMNGRRIGAAWLARVEDNDKYLPWTIEANDANFPCIAGPDCFDVKTLLTDLFSQISAQITAVTAPIPGVSATQHRLYYIPRLIHPKLAERSITAPGVGLAYAVELSVPFQSATVLIPLTIYFRRAEDGLTYSIYIDPISDEAVIDGQTIPWENLGRIAVFSNQGIALLAPTLIDSVRSAFGRVQLPTYLNNAVSAEAAMGLAIDGVTGGLLLRNQLGVVLEAIPPNFEAAFLPETGADSVGSSLVMWRYGLGADQTLKIGTPVRLQFMH